MSLLKCLSLCSILALTACSGDLSPLTPAATTTTSTTPTDVLSGQVTQAGSGAAIAKATITLAGADGTLRTATTNAAGAFSFSGLTSGAYSIQAAATGYVNSVATIAFPVTSYTVQLTPVGVSTPDFVTLNVTGTAGLNVGRTSQLTATVVLTDGTKRDVTTVAKWTSATTTVAIVSASGLVTAYTPGTSLISATFSSVTGSLTATISK